MHIHSSHQLAASYHILIFAENLLHVTNIDSLVQVILENDSEFMHIYLSVDEDHWLKS